MPLYHGPTGVTKSDTPPPAPAGKKWIPMGGSHGGGYELGDLSPQEQDAAQADQYAKNVAALAPKIDKYTAPLAGQSQAAVDSANRIDAFDPWQGFDTEMAAYTKGLRPQFDETLQGVRENAARSGTYRGGNTVFQQNRAQVGFEQQVASQLAQRGTERAGLALQARTAGAGAHRALAGDYMEGVGAESELNSGLADFYQGRFNAKQKADAESTSGWLDFFGKLAGAGATAVAHV